MKSILSAFLLSFIICAATAQVIPDQRTTTTRIADLLARMPAENNDELHKNLTNTAALGEDGLLEMAQMLVAPGSGDNSRLEYALAAFSYYTRQSGNEGLRAQGGRAYAKALDKLTNKENKAFIIRQLDIIATPDAVTSLQPYLLDERLCDPAARAMVKIHTDAAGQALLEALKKSGGSSRLTLLQALGDFRYGPAAATIAPLADGSDAYQTKTALYALGRIGDPASEKILSAAAESAHFRYEVTGATSAYIDYARQLAASGKQAEAGRIAGQLLKKCSQDDQVVARTAALKILVDLQGEKNLPLLTEAMDDKNPKYREAALKFAGAFTNQTATQQWLKKLTASNGNKTVKGEIISMLGNSKQVAALPAVLHAYEDPDAEVRARAIKASGQIGEVKALPAMLDLLKKPSTPSDIQAVSKALGVMKGDGITDAIGNALPATSSQAKATLIDALADRGAENRVGDLLPLVKSSDSLVRRSAFSALKSVATPSTLPQLFPLLLSSSQPAEIRAVQDAVISASAPLRDTVQRTEKILSEMRQAPADKQYRFFDILAAIGSKPGLQVLSNALVNGNDHTKAAAIASMSAWPNASAAEGLYQMAKQPGNEKYFDQAFTGYIRLISQSTYPADQKLLMLRKGMDISKTTAQRQDVLVEVQRCRTFVAMVFAGKYLDDPALQPQAAEAVMNIGLANKAWSGLVVRSLLEKTIGALKGADSDYERQAIRKYLAEMPAGDGIVPLFNGVDLTGWRGLVENPIKRAQMDAMTLQQAQDKADQQMRQSWSVKDGVLEFVGTGENLCTVKKYGDFEMYVDWKIDPDGDAGIYLRGSPQVQIWDTARKDAGAQVGSGGLYNNQVYESKPLVLADNAIDDWNSFHITMIGDRVTVYLNGVLVVDNIILENYWDRKLPIFSEEQIELQAHGRHVSYRDLYIREIPRIKPYVLSDEEKKEGFDLLFDGTNMHAWTGNMTEYIIEDDAIAVHPIGGNHGNLYTKKEYQDFVYRFEFQLTPGANNGIGIRAPLEGDAAYVGMEIQVLDNEADMYKNLHEYQYHGSVYGVIPAKRGYLKPLGEWNVEEITAKGTHIKVVLNGTTILDGDISDAIRNGTLDKKEHPGLKNVSGHLGFLGHGDVVKFRHMRIKDLNPVAIPPEVKSKN